jgi:hypothetical protein
MTPEAITFAAGAVALYVAHHVGDYWIQTDHQALTKGKAGHEGSLACLTHVLTYLLTQGVLLSLTWWVLGLELNYWAAQAALAVSGVTHYLADRREHGIMLKLARAVNLAGFLTVGAPREGRTVTAHGAGWKTEEVALDNGQLATGAWALDQSWHIFWGVFVAALVLAGLS